MEIQCTAHEAADLLRKFYDVANLGCTIDERRASVSEFASAAVSLFLARASGQMREDERAVRSVLDHVCTNGGEPTDKPCMACTVESGALSRLSALAQEAEALRAKVAELEKECSRLNEHAGLANRDGDAARAEVERLKVVDLRIAREEIADERRRALSAESRLAAIRETVSDVMGRCERAKLLLARWVLEGDAPQEATNGNLERQPTVAELEAILNSPEGTYRVDIQPDGQIRAVKRYPCSPTCTHDDAATPGHPERIASLCVAFDQPMPETGVLASDEARSERVRERSEAWEAMHPNGACTCAGEGTCAWCDRESKETFYDRGAEDMRAACLTAALQWAQANLGIRPQGLKDAIEGAAP